MNMRGLWTVVQLSVPKQTNLVCFGFIQGFIQGFYPLPSLHSVAQAPGVS